MSNWCSKCEWSGNGILALYCSLCGTKLVEQNPKECSKCGRKTLVPSNNKYCNGCGTKL